MLHIPHSNNNLLKCIANSSNIPLFSPQVLLEMLRGALLLTLALSAMEVRCWGWMQNLLLHDATLHRDLQKQLRPRFLWSSKNLDYFDVDDDDKKKTSNAKSQRDYGTRKSDKGYSEEVEGGGSDNGFVNMSRKQLVSFQKQFSKALLAGIFVLGIGVGVTVDSAINTNPRFKVDPKYSVNRFTHLMLWCDAVAYF